MSQQIKKPKKSAVRKSGRTEAKLVEKKEEADDKISADDIATQTGVQEGEMI